VVVVVRFLNILTTCLNMVITKLKYLIEPGRGHISHRLDTVPMGTW
jgi:hypothetical protein